MKVDQSSRSIASRAEQWINENAASYSILGCSGSRTWSTGADDLRVLASTQKLHVLAAVQQEQARTPDLPDRRVSISKVREHYVPGTDGGAFKRALAADGFDPNELEAEVTLSRLVFHMMHHSSNAASDAIADVLEDLNMPEPRNVRTSTLPPRLSKQIKAAYGDPLRPHTISKMLSTDPASRTYLGSLRYLVDLVREIDGPAPGRSRLLPRIATHGGAPVRGKRGSLPGHIAAALVTPSETIAAYAVDVRQASDSGLARAIEARLMSLAIEGR